MVPAPDSPQWYLLSEQVVEEYEEEQLAQQAN
jgi:hypothetical protein